MREVRKCSRCGAPIKPREWHTCSGSNPTPYQRQQAEQPRKAGDDAWQPDPEVIDELQSKLDENWRQQEQQRKAGGDA